MPADQELPPQSVEDEQPADQVQELVEGQEHSVEPASEVDAPVVSETTTQIPVTDGEIPAAPPEDSRWDADKAQTVGMDAKEGESSSEIETNPDFKNKLFRAAIIRAHGHGDVGLIDALKRAKEQGYLRENRDYDLAITFEANGVLAVAEATASSEPTKVNIGRTNPTRSVETLLKYLVPNPKEMRPEVSDGVVERSTDGWRTVYEKTYTYTLPNGVRLVNVIETEVSSWPGQQSQRSSSSYAYAEKLSQEEVGSTDPEEIKRMLDVTEEINHAREVLASGGVDSTKSDIDGHGGRYVKGHRNWAEDTASLPGSKWDRDVVFTYMINNDGKAVKIGQKPNAPQSWEPVISSHEFAPEHQDRAVGLIRSLADKQGERNYESLHGEEYRKRNREWAQALLDEAQTTPTEPTEALAA